MIRTRIRAFFTDLKAYAGDLIQLKIVVVNFYLCRMNEDEIPQEDQDEVLFEHHRIVADKGQALLRIDKFLMNLLPNVTRTKIQDGMHNGFVRVNDKAVKPNYKVHPQDV